MNLYSYIKEVRKNNRRFFSIEDVIKQFDVSNSYARVALHRLVKTGDLASPVRGMYVIIPPEHQHFGSIPAQDLVPLVMKHLGKEYYAGLLTAGLFHGATHQNPARFQIISNHRRKSSIIIGSVEIEFIYRKSLQGLPMQNIVVNTGYLSISTPELTMLDLLTYSYRCGGLNHIATVFSELVEEVDAEKLVLLAQSLKLEYQLQRIGYILDNIEVMDDAMKAKVLNRLFIAIKEKKLKYIALVSEIPIVGHSRCSKWKIIENATVESDL